MRSVVDKLVSSLSATIYGLVGLGLRLLVARDVFLAGQAKIAGPSIPIRLVFREGEFSVILPAEIRQSIFELFAAQYSALPIPSMIAAYLFTYAEFVLPICLVLGFASRLSALALLAMAGLIQFYGAPALWPAHLYLIAMLSVLFTVGPGAISIDAWIRRLYRR
jgi:putative oxidoreductase